MSRNTRLLLASVAALAAVPFVAAQGALTPPGAPAPTMKSLTEIDSGLQGLAAKAESRTAIETLTGNAAQRYIISTPGSYYLRGPLSPTFAGQIAITVSVSNVVIDLNGQTLDGAGGAGGGTYAVYVQANVKNVTVRNGTIVNWTTVGVQGLTDSSLVAEDLTVAGGQGGVSCPNGTVRRVQVRGTTSYGIFADTVVDCHVRDVSSAGALLYGIDANTVQGCTVTNVTTTAGQARGIDASVASQCHVTGITASGGNASGFIGGSDSLAVGCRASGITSSTHAAYGFSVDKVTDFTVRNIQGATSAYGVFGASVTSGQVITVIASGGNAYGLSVTTAHQATVETVTGSSNAVGVGGSAFGCRVNGISGSATTGILGSVAHQSHVSNVSTTLGSVTGISAVDIDSCTVTSVTSPATATGVSGTGVRDTTVSSVVGASASVSSVRGIVAANVVDCTVTTVTGNTSTACRGIQADRVRDCTVETVTANSLGTVMGIYAANTTGCTVQRVTNANAGGLGNGIVMNTLDGNTALLAVGIVEKNTVSGCSTYAIYTAIGGRIAGNLCYNANNVGTGISCGGRGTVTDNETTGFSIGYDMLGAGTLLARNVSNNDTTAFLTVAGVRAGTVQVGGGVANDANANFDL